MSINHFNILQRNFFPPERMKMSVRPLKENKNYLVLSSVLSVIIPGTQTDRMGGISSSADC